MDHLIEKTTDTKEIFKGRVISLQIETVELPNGKTSTREIIKHPGAVAVIPVTGEGKLVLVKQFRKALEKVIYEIPAGKLEAGEDPLACAARELEEETGYKSSELSFVQSFYTSPGFADELIYLYFTDQLENGTINTDEDEFLDVVEVTLAEAEKLMQQQLVHDAKTMFAIQYLRLQERRS